MYVFSKEIDHIHKKWNTDFEANSFVVARIRSYKQTVSGRCECVYSSSFFLVRTMCECVPFTPVARSNAIYCAAQLFYSICFKSQVFFCARDFMSFMCVVTYVSCVYITMNIFASLTAYNSVAVSFFCVFLSLFQCVSSIQDPNANFIHIVPGFHFVTFMYTFYRYMLVKIVPMRARLSIHTINRICILLLLPLLIYV